MIIDLHTHTSCSDGKLSPSELIHRAQSRGVNMLAITDHDNVDAHRQTYDNLSLQLIRGIEISSQWQGMGIHVVGLNIDIENTELLTEITKQQQKRQQRNQLICANLQKKCINIDYDELIKTVSPTHLGRLHIAEHLVKTEHCKDIAQAFRKYLSKKEIIGSQQTWPTLTSAINTIITAGGVAVLAHPNLYKLTRTKLKRLLKNFKEAGGGGLEVVSAFQTAEVTDKFSLLCLEYQLLASSGSDFHQQGAFRCDVGANEQLAKYLQPVWQHWTNVW